MEDSAAGAIWFRQEVLVEEEQEWERERDECSKADCFIPADLGGEEGTGQPVEELQSGRCGTTVPPASSAATAERGGGAEDIHRQIGWNRYTSDGSDDS